MIEKLLISSLKAAIKEIYNADIPDKLAQVQKTRTEFEGDFTIVVFPFLKISKKSPVDTAQEIGEYFVSKVNEVDSFNIIKGFLNLSISTEYWLNFFLENKTNISFGKHTTSEKKPLVIEYSSPNTNKPLHLGHIRNNLLGWSVSAIMKNSGVPVKKVNLVNDRGIHICKSMLAWKKWGNGETPETSGIKGDKLVGNYYVEFDKNNKLEIARLIDEGTKKEDAEKSTKLLKDAKDLLVKWEGNDPEVRDLWATMNNWVYDGFEKTYARMGIDFDRIYYESNTYLLGKELVNEGLDKGIFFQKEDGSVWCDLTDRRLNWPFWILLPASP